MEEDKAFQITDLQRLEAERVTKRSPSTSSGPVSGPSFTDVLNRQMADSVLPKGASDTGSVTFSSHALQRLQKRSIVMDAAKMNRLNDAVDRLAQKGARESLIMMDDLALIVGIKHRTVITAMDSQSMKGNIITNIDSAIIT